MKDWRGTEIRHGDVVVYPGRQSSSMWMNEGVVVDMDPGNLNADSYWDRIQPTVRVRRQFDSNLLICEGKGEGKVNTQRVVTVQAMNVTVVMPRGMGVTVEDGPVIEIDGAVT